MVNWWLDKGLAGFRIDAIMNIKKTDGFPDYEPDGEDGLVRCTRMIEEAEGIGEFFRELKQETFAKHDAFTVAEVFNMKEGELEKFVGRKDIFPRCLISRLYARRWGRTGGTMRRDMSFSAGARP